MNKSKILDSLTLSILKAIGSAASYAHIFLIAKQFSKESSGQYFAAYNTVLLASVIFTFGLNTFLAKNVPIAEERRSIEGYYSALLLAPPLILAGVFLLSSYLGLQLELTLKDSRVDLYRISLCIVAAVVATISLGAIQGRQQIKSYIIAQAILPLLPIFAFFVFGSRNSQELEYLIDLLTIGYMASAVFCTYRSKALISGKLSLKKLTEKLEEIGNFWIIQVSQIGMFTGASIISAQNLSSSEYSDFVVFSRIAALVGFVSIATNISLSPKISGMLGENNISALRAEILSQNRINTAFGIFAMLVILLFSNRIMEVIQGDVQTSLIPLYILTISQTAIISLGPIAPMMSMLNLGRQYMWINIILAPISLITMYFGSKYFGLVGVASIYSGVMLLQNLVCRQVLRNRYSFIKTL